MARIRSIHPGIYTDEAWASVSIVARWFAKGLCTEADDNGTFEWKPLQLKMRIFPADAVSVPDLLAELVGAGIVMQFAVDGKSLGALRNFCKYQRPRKPKAWFPTTAESLAFAAVGSAGVADDEVEATPVPKRSELSAVEPANVRPKSEKSPQMEDGGGRREEITVAIAPSVAAGDGEGDFEALWKAYPHVKGRSSKPKARLAWDLLEPETRKALPAAAARFKAEGVMPQSGPCALDRWLDEARWIDWLGSDAAPSAPILWRGPDDVRAAFLAKFGENWVRTYLDRCAWQDVPERTLIPATGVAAVKIRREARDLLTQLNIIVLEKAA